MKSSLALFGFLWGAAIWWIARELLASTFDKQALFGHVLESPVNLFSFGTFSEVLAITAAHCLRLRREAGWVYLGVLPEGEEFRTFADVEQFSRAEAAQGPRRKLRPLCLHRTCFDSVRGNWSRASAHQALQTQFDLMRDAADAQYGVLSNRVGRIVAIGFVGTLLGLGQAMGAIPNGTDAAIIELHVAFDTSLVAMALSMIASDLQKRLKKYDSFVLVSAVDAVLHNFVLRIKDSED